MTSDRREVDHAVRRVRRAQRYLNEAMVIAQRLGVEVVVDGWPNSYMKRGDDGSDEAPYVSVQMKLRL